MTSTGRVVPDLAPASGAALLERVAAGDEQALAELYDRLGPWVLAIAGRRAPAEPAAVLVHQVFMRIWRAAPRFPHQRLSAGAWIVGEIDRTLAERAVRAGPGSSA